MKPPGRRRRNVMNSPLIQPYHRPISIELEHEIAVKFRREAARREMTVQGLVREILDVVATDRLTTAILDTD
jgi:hypothetical protein